MKIVFLGSSGFAVECLKEIKDDVVAVFTQPDRKVGRKQELKGTPVKEFAFEQGLDVLQPAKASELAGLIESFEPDFIVVVAYGLILPQEVLDIPKNDTLNVHGSLLPKYRGAAPIHFALMNGDEKTGVCVMRVSKRMDAGPVYQCVSIDIDPEDDFATLHDKMALAGAKLLKNTLNEIVEINLEPIIQDEPRATYCSKITKEFGQIDFVSMSAKEISNRYRAFKYWPKLSFEYKDKRFKLLDFEVTETELNPGEMRWSEDGLLVGTKKKSLLIKDIQPESKSPMQILDFQLGNPDFFETEPEPEQAE